jgi:hypothetical protein
VWVVLEIVIFGFAKILLTSFSIANNLFTMSLWMDGLDGQGYFPGRVKTFFCIP